MRLYEYRCSGCGPMLRKLAIAAALVQVVFQTVAAQPPATFRVVASGLGMPWEVVAGPTINSG